MKEIYKLRKQSLFDYFQEEYKDFIYEIVKSFKITNYDYYELIVELWGYNYDKYTGKSIDYEEKKILIALKQKIRRYIKEVENNEFRGFTGYYVDVFSNGVVKINFNHSKNGNKTKEQFLDYFNPEDEELILKIVDLFKIYYPDYYFSINYYYYGDKYQIKKTWVSYNYKVATLFNSARIKINKIIDRINNMDTKEYNLEKIVCQRNTSKFYLGDDNIDTLYEEIEETDEIKDNIDILYDTMEELADEKEKIMENSLYRQYDKYSSVYVKKMLPKTEHWIRQIFNKAWGKNGVECNKLSFKDEEKLNKAILAFEKILIENATENSTLDSTCKEDIELKLGLKEYLNEYFDKEGFNYVLIIMKEYREKNPYYYYVLSKLYGKNFNQLQEKVIVTKKDLVAFKDIILELRKKLDQRKNTLKFKTGLENNFKNYFSEKNFPLVLKIIEEYKEKNPYYYYILSKLYDKDFDQLQDNNITEKDLLIFKDILLDIRKNVKMFLNKSITKDSSKITSKKYLLPKKNMKKEVKSKINNNPVKETKLKIEEVKTDNIEGKITKVQRKESTQIESLADYFKATDENISEAVEYLPLDERQCIKLYFGIGMRRFSLKEMENILKISEKDIIYYIKSAIIIMGNTVRMIKDRENKEKVVTKIKVRPKAYKKQ